VQPLFDDEECRCDPATVRRAQQLCRQPAFDAGHLPPIVRKAADGLEIPGDTIVVVETGDDQETAARMAKRVEIDKKRQTVKLFDKSNSLIGFYPATMGSEEKPSPEDTVKVTGISRNPTYRYNPDYHFKGVHTHKPFTIKPGPNNPVGTIWINLSVEGYGIHGTPLPAKVSKAESHGCVRLTNWDAERVAERIAKGTPVTFLTDPR
jgi:lipoprotein-anchoring transpeptidase ErfK/SrfK